ncbi:MAG TPA: bifunctional oligoribonuclease/PAP phosphatase NrnA [Armatimonadota bacterium]|nr:bifunctional oligoribonuclease/PAP phosphatase NrnA [Armatimonadota bacterium]
MTKSDLQDAVSILRECSDFLIAGHVSPDGDCLGCMCALALALQGPGKSVVLVNPDGVPDLYRYLPGSDRVVREVPAGRRFDAAIVVDCEGLDRLGVVAEALPLCRRVLEIDHHPGGRPSSDVQLVDPSAASCGEIVVQLLNEAGIKIEHNVAECLLTAVVTDTGSFRFSSVKPSTLRAAATLIEAGASISKVARRVYETRSLSSVKLLGIALSTLRTTADGQIVYTSITRDQMALSSAADAETEGIVNYVRSVRGAQVGILFRECQDGNTKVSLRSRDGLDISQVARLFGGGGHRAAAGCTVERPLSDAVGLVVDAVQKWMGS